MHLQDAVQDYLLYITHEKRVSRTTNFGYRSYLHAFMEWLKANGYPEPTLSDFTTPVLRRYLYDLSDKGLRPRTLRGRFHPLIGLGAFLVETDILTENPAKAIKMPRKDPARRLLVSDAEVVALLEACERQPDQARVALTRAMLSVLVFAGLRREELLSLQVSDVQFATGSILVRNGKGGKSRTVYVCDACLNAIREWLVFRPKECTHDFLWARDRSHRIYQGGLASILKTIKAIAGMSHHENIQPHSLRHNYASRLLANGADIKSIQAALGHAQLSTTAIYLHLSEQAAKEVAHLSALPIPTRQTEEKLPSPTSEAADTDRDRFRRLMQRQQERGRFQRRRLAR